MLTEQSFRSSWCSPVCVSSTSRALLTAALLAVAPSCGGGSHGGATVVTPPPVVDSSLGPDDVFEVRVFGEQELTGTYRVAHNGTIDFPLIGTLQVAGLTPPEVSELVRQRLREGQFLISPQVSVLVKEYNSKRISVFGQVQRPGTFPYQDSMDIVHAITLAGGFTAIADPDHTTVTRRRAGHESRRRVPVESIGTGQSSNFYLQPGDTIFVPESVF